MAQGTLTLRLFVPFAALCLLTQVLVPTGAAAPARDAYVPPFSGFEGHTNEGWTQVRFNPDQTFPAYLNFYQSFVLSFAESDFPQLQGPGAWYFEAPEKFRGDHSRIFNGSIEFDMARIQYANPGPAVDDLDLIVRGADKEIIYEAFPEPPPGFGPHGELRHYSIPLRTGIGWTVDDEVHAATASDFKSVLGAIEGLWIRGKFFEAEGDFQVHGLLDNITYKPGTEGKVKVRPLTVNFRRVRVGDSTKRRVIVSNVTRKRRDTLHVRIVGTDVAAFSTPLEGEDLEVEPGHFARVPVTFAPTVTGPAKGGHLRLETSDPDFPVVIVDLRGSGR
jgi:hypothetical protein